MKKLAVLLLVAVTLFGCSKKSPTATTTVQAKFIVAELNLYRWWGSTPYFYEWVEILSDPAPNVAQCSAQMKFGTTSFQLTSYKYQGPGGVGLQDTFHFPYPGIACSLFVNTNVGNSRSGGVSAPGTYTINSPPDRDTLAWGDMAISWSQAQYATWYDLSLNYYAYNGTNHLGDADTQLIATGTSALIPQAFFRKYGSSTYVEAYFSVNAHTGAAPGAGAVGNLTGDIKGVFYSTFGDSGSSRYFYMGSPKLALGSATPHPQISHEKRRQFIIRAFGLPVKAEAD